MKATVLDGQLGQLDLALEILGFLRDCSGADALVYTGALCAHGKKHHVKFKITDFNLTKLPKIYFIEHPGDSSVITPHILPNLEFCFATDKTTTWLNHDNPIDKVTGCIAYAEVVLEQIITGKLEEDITAEFSAYWHGTPLLLDIPSEYEGAIKTLTLSGAGNGNANTYNCVSDDVGRTKKLLSPTGMTIEAANIHAYVIQLDKALFPNVEQWPPTTLGELSDWLRDVDKDTWKSFRKQIVSNKFIKTRRLIVVFMHHETQFSVLISLDNYLAKASFKPNEKFRKFLFELKKGRDLPIERYTPFRIDNNYLMTRGHEEQPALAGKTIILVGCGTIGGYLAHLLVRAGCGTNGGELILVDPDIILPGNIGRHILGIEFLFKEKTTALSQHIKRDLPLAKITTIHGEVQSMVNLERADLLIDATGDEGLSMYLNQLRVDGNAPDTIHTWINGAGIAAQAFLAQSDSACLRCLTDLKNKKIFSPIKLDKDEFVQGQGCDDYFIPYPGSVSAQAAGLAANLAIDWARKSSSLRLRTILFDYKLTNEQKPRNPSKLKGCPICSTEHG